MYSKWTSHLKDEQSKQNFRLQVISARDVLNRQKQINEEWEKNLDRSEIDPRQFDTPNWEYRQAWKNGFRAALHQSKTLIDLDQQETNVDRE